MTNTNKPDDEIYRYLLGIERSERAAEIERQILQDSDFHLEVEIRKRELIDRYVRGELSRKEQNLFIRRFLGSDLGRREVMFARALCRRADPAGESQSFLSWRSRFVAPSSFWYKPALAATLIIAAVLGLDDLRLTRRLTESANEMAALNRVLEKRLESIEMSSRYEDAEVAALMHELEKSSERQTLFSGQGSTSTPRMSAEWSSREHSQAAILSSQMVVAELSEVSRVVGTVIALPTGVRAVRFVLHAPDNWRGETSVQLMDDRGNVIASALGIDAKRVSGRAVLIVTFPTDHLKGGDYLLRAISSSLKSEYGFTILAAIGPPDTLLLNREQATSKPAVERQLTNDEVEYFRKRNECEQRFYDKRIYEVEGMSIGAACKQNPDRKP